MPQWTTKQEEAIYFMGHDILVSAGAGAGKTAVLSERILQRICNKEDPVDIDRFLIVTFTNAAAAEMRSRISRKISEALEQDPTNSHLQRQLTLLYKADITTIHSFCLGMIRNNFHLIDIDPGAVVGSGPSIDILKMRCCNEVCEQMYTAEDGETFARLMDLIGKTTDESAGPAAIIRIYDYIRSFPNPLQWLQEQTEKYNISKESETDQTQWAMELRQSFKIELDGTIREAQRLIELAQALQADFYLPAFLQDEEMLLRLQAACSGSWEQMHEAAGECGFVRLRSKPKDFDPDVAQRCRDVRDKIKKMTGNVVNEILYFSPSLILSGLQQAYPLMRILQKTIERFDAEYTLAKKEEALLDFSDFEHYALKLLSSKSFSLAEELRQKYVEIFVDEYQDCNSVQEALFSYICKRKDGKSTNMFMVGDVKQSIYRFRQGDPTIFMGKNDLYARHSEEGKMVALNRNFRSRPEIIEGINRIFSRIMSEHVGEIAYDTNQQLSSGAQYPPCAHSVGGPIALLIAQTDVEEEEPIDSNLQEDEEEQSEQEYTLPLRAIQMEAQMVAAKIRQLIDEGPEVFDATQGKYRPITYKDITVLLRSPTGRAECFEEAFEQQAIPYHTDAGSGLFFTLEMKMLISILRIIDNPKQDIPLLGVLRCPLFGFSEDELLQIKRQGGMVFHDALMAFAELTPSGKLGEKCKDFLQKIVLWRSIACSVPTDILIERILLQIDFYAFAAALPMPQQRIANLHLLLSYAREFEEGGFRGLFGFLSYVENIREHPETGVAKLMSENSDVVRIMSIHKSKGLEFPVVFVCATSAKFNNKDSRSSLLLHKSLGIGMDYLDRGRRIKYKLLPKAAIVRRIKNENMSEEMRILYVALTRAKEKLFITAAKKGAKQKLQQWMEVSQQEGSLPLCDTSRANSFFDWICGCIDKSWEVSIEEAVAGPALMHRQAPILQSEAHAELSGEIDRRLSFEYPHKAATQLPGKISVTELKRRNEYAWDPESALLHSKKARKPSFAKEEQALGAEQRGTLSHLVLRHVTLSDLEPHKALKTCAEDLVRRKFITESERWQIDFEGMEAFLQSPLGQRLRSARTVYREMPFNMDIPAKELLDVVGAEEETVLLQGVIDCLFCDEKGWVLLDYKTDRPMPDTEIIKRYGIQMAFYEKAAQRIIGGPALEKIIYLLASNKAILL